MTAVPDAWVRAKNVAFSVRPAPSQAGKFVPRTRLSMDIAGAERSIRMGAELDWGTWGETAVSPTCSSVPKFEAGSVSGAANREDVVGVGMGGSSVCGALAPQAAIAFNPNSKINRGMIGSGRFLSSINAV